MTQRDGPPLVSVVVPAYNAEATLAETLASIAAQSWRALEIVVVDDGSTDGTAAVARRFAAADARARPLTIANGGVALARNRGVAESTGEYVAPIDADDLWHPHYLAKLVARLRAAPEGTSFAYAACRLIDARSDILGFGLNAGIEGWAARRMAYCNFVGSGSGMVMTRRAFDAAGGYDARLHAAGCQGCEDHLLQMRLAALGPIAAVPEYLVGYRQRAEAMSRDVRRMIASDRLARQLLGERPPPPARWIAAYRWLLAARADAAAGRLGGAALSLGRAMLDDPAAAAAAVAARLEDAARRLLRPPPPRGVHFLDADPASADAAPDIPAPGVGAFRRLQLARLKRLAASEAPPAGAIAASRSTSP